MLVVVSDMHLADGSAGEHNLEPQVYHDLLDQLATAHAKVREFNPHSRVEIVYAGNIFELRRTHFWFEQGDHKPWRHFGVAQGAALAKPPQSPEYLQRAVQLFTRIMTHANVSPIKGILGDKLADRFGGIEPIRAYLPGDADRLINMSEDLRARVIDFLGLDLGREQGWDPAQRFPNTWLDPYHGAFIRHGHEWDVYSFEGGLSSGGVSRPEDYDNIPMSDLITTELFARLTYEASVLQGGAEAPAELVAEFNRKLQQIDNVRPVSALVRWLAQHFENPVEKRLLGTCIERALNNFKNQEYVSWWLSFAGHDKLWTPFDEADRIEWLLEGLKHLWMGKIDVALSVYDKFASYDPYARYVEHAATEPALTQADSPVHYVVYGHTHHAEHVPLGMIGNGPNRRMAHYVNTGSLRPTHTVTRDGKDFFVSETLDFAIFYRADEKPGAIAPSFELRTLKRSRRTG
jgi:UDP-2,3-diacylglucosamine pyrophosphatase LpxH